MKIAFANPGLPTTGIVCVAVMAGRKLTDSAKGLDKQLKGAVSRAVKVGQFEGKRGQSVSIPAPAGSKLDAVLVVGLGEAKSLDALACQDMGGRIYSAVSTARSSAVSICVDAVRGCKLGAGDIAAEMALGARLRSYRFDKYRTKMEESAKPTIKTLTFRGADAAKARRMFTSHDKVADGVLFTRDLVSEPANILYPDTLAKEARKLSKLGVKIEVLKGAQLKKLGMGALLGVAQGSVREPRVVVMQWNGAAKKPSKGKDGPIAFIGKGVTFDTGGISIKPAGGMEDMKWDMGGSGVVIGLMKALAGRKAKVNVVGIVGLVENMPGGNAQRPGDIVTSMSGQTIEVLNTDAEGRLVLADVLHYCNERFKPRMMVDLATLTGAIIIALGEQTAGLFSNNDELATAISTAGDKVAEKVWRLPLGEEYDKMINSDAADMKNISGDRGAGSITAAQFLQRFVGDTPWAHLDIAGVTWSKKDKPTVPKGGTGFGVRLLDRMVADFYEGK
ncbi:MAG: leucyl aminopeptidase [Rhodospirillales bacterium]|nr:leucyl aminopeptidase [Rhodospirillales bacterium]